MFSICPPFAVTVIVISSSTQYFIEDASDFKVRPPTLIGSPIVYGFVGSINWTAGPTINGPYWHVVDGCGLINECWPVANKCWAGDFSCCCCVGEIMSIGVEVREGEECDCICDSYEWIWWLDCACGGWDVGASSSCVDIIGRGNDKEEAVIKGGEDEVTIVEGGDDETTIVEGGDNDETGVLNDICACVVGYWISWALNNCCDTTVDAVHG